MTMIEVGCCVRTKAVIPNLEHCFLEAVGMVREIKPHDNGKMMLAVDILEPNGFIPSGLSSTIWVFATDVVRIAHYVYFYNGIAAYSFNEIYLYIKAKEAGLYDTLHIEYRKPTCARIDIIGEDGNIKKKCRIETSRRD